jgi:hypothetical protein
MVAGETVTKLTVLTEEARTSQKLCLRQLLAAIFVVTYE